MSGLRQLLRLDDKVAAEGRRLQSIGGPSTRWVGPMVLMAAATLHGLVMLLPAMRIPLTPPAATPEPDFPIVWRFAPPVAPPQAVPTASPAESVRAVPTPFPPIPKPETRAPRAFTTEPVPEPAPELALRTISADVEEIIPRPDTPPPSLELGPPSGVVPAAPQEAAPKIVERVQPRYPVAARSLRAEGRVTLRLAVLPDGSVGKAAVEECSRTGLGFEAAALDAVKRWRYEPAPPESGSRKVVVTVHFQAQGARP